MGNENCSRGAATRRRSERRARELSSPFPGEQRAETGVDRVGDRGRPAPGALVPREVGVETLAEVLVQVEPDAADRASGLRPPRAAR